MSNIFEIWIKQAWVIDDCWVCLISSIVFIGPYDRRAMRSSGKRNLENDQELTVRTGITHVLNLANDVNLGPN